MITPDTIIIIILFAVSAMVLVLSSYCGSSSDYVVTEKFGNWNKVNFDNVQKREILVRGFHPCKNGNDVFHDKDHYVVFGTWVYGSLILNKYDNPCIIVFDSDLKGKKKRRMKMFHVIPQSICQMVDSENNIFEDDILLNTEEIGPEGTINLGLVRWDYENSQWVVLPIHGDIEPYNTSSKWRNKSSYTRVFGNIYEYYWMKKMFNIERIDSYED